MSTELLRMPVSAFIPHTGNMILLNRILDFDENSLTSEVIVRGDGLLGDDTVVPVWVGIEYMAQTIAAYSGVMATIANTPVQLGYLLGTRRYSGNVSDFKTGAVLIVKVTRLFQDEGLGSFECQIQGEGVSVVANLNVYQPTETAKELR